ncbi:MULTISPECIES: alpha/beta fold hydrolase [Streptomyces]|uniref:alpha/beta fold hydrolase n=1 Tax=Streptomyces TaxID=1883 RepID=UPI0007C76BDB|nr:MULTISPECIES: alpha/beta hydrolase [Streptomyces]
MTQDSFTAPAPEPALSAFSFTCDGELLSCAEAPPAGPPRSPATTVVLLHGAGSGDKTRLAALQADAAARGCRALALDFSGHGESSGALRELSLRRRFEQAAAVVERRVPAADALVFVGFSMSGQTVADLVAHFGARVTGIGLCAPAVYAAEAWPLPFGDGDGRFTEVIRTPDRWRESAALDVYRGFGGRAVLVVPGTDAVIPAAVTAAVDAALATRARYERLELPDADHALGAWLRDHAADRGRLLDALLGRDGMAGRDGLAGRDAVAGGRDGLA